MESTPLLAGDYAAVKTFPEMRSVFTQETVKMWKIAGPVAFYTVCQYGLNSVTSMFVGHIGDLELSAVAMSLSVIGTFTTGFMFHMLGIYMQRSWIILLVSCFFLLPIYIFATPILILLGQEEAIANLAGKFTLLMIPQLFSMAINFPTAKFLQAQSKVIALAWINFAALIIQILLLWLLIFKLGWGITGAALAFDITSWGSALAQVVYVVGWCNEGWDMFSWLAFKDLWKFVKLSLASAVMLCLEVWYSMSTIVLTGHLGNAVIDVGSYSIWLGSGRPRAAKYAVYIIVVQSFLIGLLCMAAVLITKDYFAVLFTHSKDLQIAASKLAFLLGINMVLNSVQPVISGVAIGAGWQGFVAYINIFCYYIFGLPLGVYLGYQANLGVTTLCGQAYGAGQVHMLGIYMQRSWIILLVSCFFLLPVYIFATPILVFLGQEEAIANLAGKFTLQVIPQLFSLAINFPTGKFLQAQSKVNAVGVAIGAGWQGLVAYINVFCYYVFGLPLGFLLGYKANLGVTGIWSGMIAGTALQTLLLLIILYRTNWNKEVEETSERMRRWGGEEVKPKGKTNGV
ncbi:Protein DETOXIFICATION 35 [Linum perenne]